MKNSSVFDTFISTRMMAMLMLIFAIAIGVATFVENSYDTITAQRVIFHASWFKVVLILLCINFIGNIKRYRLFRREKWSILLVHLGMILTLVGAAITHVVGFEGMIMLNEGEATNKMYSSEPFFSLLAVDKNTNKVSSNLPHYKMKPTEYLSNDFSLEAPLTNGKIINIEYVNYQSGMKMGGMEENQSGGMNYLEVVFAKMVSEYIPEGGSLVKNGRVFTYNNPKAGAINIYGDTEADLQIDYNLPIPRLSMDTKISDTLLVGSNPFKKRHLHSFFDVQLVFKGLKINAKQSLVKAEKNGSDVLTVDIKYNNETQRVLLWGGLGMPQRKVKLEMGDQLLSLGFGAIFRKLPFTIRLDDFILETYPGTNSPSGYKSEVTVFGDTAKAGEHHSIFMNNVLDRDGYRVFQSSYSINGTVEQSVFSVNHDAIGTLITYIAYVLLSLGFIMSLFNKSSRFLKLGKSLINSKAKNITTILTVLFTISGIAQSDKFEVSEPFDIKTYQPISQEHCDKFNSLMVMSYTDRIQPCNSLAFDLLRKLARKDKYTIDELGITLSPEQVLLDMCIQPDFWVDQPIIKFDARTGLGKVLNVEGKYLKFSDILQSITFEGNQYYNPVTYIQDGKEITFDSLVTEANQKAISKRTTFDKEVIKLNEKMGLFYQAINGGLLRIFPIILEEKEHWVDLNDEKAKLRLDNGAPSELNVTGATFIGTYLMKVAEAKQSGDYTDADQMLEIIKKRQRSIIPAEHLPSESKLELEITSNKMNIFSRLKYVYALLGLLLLPLTLIDKLSEKNRAGLKKVIFGFSIVLLLAVLLHTFNLGFRWYIIGHAPWSNGYEALTLVAWAVGVVGLLFSRFSNILLGAAAILSFFILMTAGHSKYDPQMSDLEPVLKSYWLIIHVACLTISYGFFGITFILSLVNMGIFAFRSTITKLNQKNIKELTSIMEMVMTIGLVLATIGTFLGGVWANESWGRYWGWDAKETWALVIVMVYALILHFRFVPGLRGPYAFNLATGIGFSSVIMTFIGVNYYLTKGLHSYARGDTPVFAWWVFAILGGIFTLFLIAGIRNKKQQKKVTKK